MHSSPLLKELTARLLVEPLLAAGIAPRQGSLRDLFHWTLHERDVRFPPRHPLKSAEAIASWDNTFALSRSSLLWLWARLRRTRPRSVLEFGSGRTTFALATYAQFCAKRGWPIPKIVTIESESDWLLQTRSILQEHGLASSVEFLQAEAIAGREAHGYALEGLPLETHFGERPIDFLLIDGPSGGAGRFGTLHSVYHLLANNAEIFLDDCDRQNERSSLETWAKEFQGELKSHGILPTVGGLGWLSRCAS